MGDRRPPSPLGDIQPDGWLAEYTTELINVLNVLGRLTKLEPKLAELLERICAGPTINGEDLKETALNSPAEKQPPKTARRRTAKQIELL